MNGCVHPLLLVLLIVGAAPIYAQTTRLVASSGTDAGDCTVAPCATIRYAIGQAADGDRIEAAAGTYTEVNVVVDRDVTIRGAGRDATVVQAAAAPWTAPGRVVTVPEGATVVIEDLTLRNGHDLEEARGGGLKNLGDVTLRHVAVLDNVAPEAGIVDYGPAGGGLYNQGTMRLDRVLVRGNVAERPDPDIPGSSGGGGVYNRGLTGAEVLHIVDSVIDANVADVGGGVMNQDAECYCAGPILHIEGSTISRNQAIRAGGIGNSGGDAAVVNSTISGNEAIGLFGGGIEASWGPFLLSHSTVTGNSAFLWGGGIRAVTLSLKNTIIAGNTAPDGPDCYSMHTTPPPTSLDYNLIGDPSGCILQGLTTHTLFGVDPELGPLADNGGPTPTHAFLSGSPAEDAGTCEGVGGTLVLEDQRGASRRGFTRSEPCDIGAFDRGGGSWTGGIEALTGVVAGAPGTHVLSPAYPNPFNPRTTFSLTLAEAEAVTVTLVDALGREVARLHDGPLAAEHPHRFEVDGHGLPSGVYVVAVEGETFRDRLRLTLVR